MALSEKQAVVIGVGAVAVLYLMKGKGKSLLTKTPAGAKTAAGRAPAAIPSSAARPSANVATGAGTRVQPQNPSIRVGGPNGVQIPASAVGGLFGGLIGGIASIFKGNTPSPTKPAAPGAPPKTGGGGGGGAPSGGGGGGRNAPGGNPWSDGLFVGQSTVTGNAAPLNGTLQGYDTGVSSGEYADAVTPNVSPSGTDWLSQARDGMDADGSPSDEPPAVGYDDGGQIADSGSPLPSTPFDLYGFGDDSTAAGDPNANQDASVYTDESWIPQDWNYDQGGVVPTEDASAFLAESYIPDTGGNNEADYYGD